MHFGFFFPNDKYEHSMSSIIFEQHYFRLVMIYFLAADIIGLNIVKNNNWRYLQSKSMIKHKFIIFLHRKNIVNSAISFKYLRRFCKNVKPIIQWKYLSVICPDNLKFLISDRISKKLHRYFHLDFKILIYQLSNRIKINRMQIVGMIFNVISSKKIITRAVVS